MDRRTAIRALATAAALPAISAHELTALLDARQTLSRDVGVGGHLPRALSPAELEVVRTVADVILPPDDTPGASDLGVPAFVDLIVEEWFDPDMKSVFLDGLANLDAEAQRQYGAAFVDCTPGEQTALVTALDEDLETLRTTEDADLQASFFYWMKRLTVTGYFTTAEGAMLVGYRTLPGRFTGCLVPEPAQ